MHLTKFGVIDIFPKFKMAVAAIFDLYIHLYSLEEDMGLPTKAYPWCVTHVKKIRHDGPSTL